MADDEYKDLAANSHLLAEESVRQRKYGRAFSHLLVTLTLCPAKKQQLKELFNVVFSHWTERLTEIGHYSELFISYEQALSLYPNDSYLLSSLGCVLLNGGHEAQALAYFFKALKENGRCQAARNGVQAICNLFLPRWHYRMLNDKRRNISFSMAIESSVGKGITSVLDIGTGTGILSMMSSKAGAASVYACESESIMFEIAREVLEDNGMKERVEVINKLSNDLNIPSDIPARVNLVVTETFDAGLLGERVLETLLHAWNCLLLPPHTSSCENCSGCGRVIPASATVFVALIECRYFARRIKLVDASKTFQRINFSLNTEEPYDSEFVKNLPGSYRMLTEAQKLLELDFRDVEQVKKALNGSLTGKKKIEAIAKGRVDAIMMFFHLHLSEKIMLSSDPSQASCWEQALYPVQELVCVNEKDTVDVMFAVKGDHIEMKLNADYPTSSAESVTLSQKQFSMLNSSSWFRLVVEEIEHCLAGLKGDVHIIDVSSFPLSSLEVVKNFGNTRLTLVKNDAYQTVHSIVDALDVSSRVAFVSRNELIGLDRVYDIAVSDVVDEQGILTEGCIEMSVLLKLNCLKKTTGVMVPTKLNICLLPIESEALLQKSRLVSDKNALGWKIAGKLNLLQAPIHLDLHKSTLPHINLCRSVSVNIFDCSELDFSSCEKAKEMSLDVITQGSLSAVLFWFEMHFEKSKRKLNSAEDYVIEKNAGMKDDRLLCRWNQAAFMVDSPVSLPEGAVLSLKLLLKDSCLTLETL